MPAKSKPTRQPYEIEDMRARQHDAYAHAKYELLLSWLGAAADTPRNILNVGCGSGELCILLAQRGHTVLGIDPAVEYVSLASARAEQQNLSNCHFEISDLRGVNKGQPHRQYDVVFSTDVVEHIADDVEAIGQLTALVRPGGDLFLTVPGGQYLFGYHDEQLGHYRRYSLRQLADRLPLNLEIKKLRYFGFSLIPVAWLYSRALRSYYPVSKTGNKKTNPVLTHTVRFVLSLEQKIRPPLGTSCLLWAKKSTND